MCNTSMHPQLDSMVKLYKKTVEKHLRKITSTHHRTGTRVCPSSCWTTETQPGKYRRNAHQHGASRRPTSTLRPAVQDYPNNEQPMTDYMMNLMEWLHDSHHYVRQHLKMASNKIMACYGCTASYMGFQEGTTQCILLLYKVQNLSIDVAVFPEFMKLL